MRWIAVVLVCSSVVAISAASLRAATEQTSIPGTPGVIAYPCVVEYHTNAGPAHWPELCLRTFFSGGVIKVVGTGPEAEVDPAWSPDGTRLAYVTRGVIYIKSIWERKICDLDCRPFSAGKVRRLTSSGSDSQPAWSPDGTRLAFVSRRGGSADIYVTRAAGGPVTRLTRNAHDDLDPAWSPDGKRIAFSRDSTLYVVAAGGGTVRSLGSGQAPAWSPDGKQLAFESGDDIWLARADGKGRRNLTRSTGVKDTQPSWSPDGKRLAFAGLPDGESLYDLFLVAPGKAPSRFSVGGDHQRPFVAPSLDWQNVQELVFTVSTKRPIVSIRDRAGRQLRVIRAGFYSWRMNDRSTRDGFSGLCCKTSVSAVVRSARRLEEELGMLQPGVYKYSSPAHPTTARGTLRVVDP